MSFIILDRDGVINHESSVYIKTPDEWLPIPGSLEAIANLNRHGFQVLVATNQSGVARGFYDLDMLEKIHTKFHQALAAVGGEVQEIFFCPHHPDDHCGCRKPKAGLFHQIAAKYAINFTETYFIGDSFVDVQAAQAVGCMPLLVQTGNGKTVLEKYPQLSTVPHFENLAKAVDYVIARQANHG